MHGEDIAYTDFFCLRSYLEKSQNVSLKTLSFVEFELVFFQMDDSAFQGVGSMLKEPLSYLFLILI
jgi:hypothetical protein